MSRSICLHLTLGSLLVVVFLNYALALFACPPSYFQCSNGICIPRPFFCNGHDDCKDNSDERYCFKSPFNLCPSGWYQCPNELRCIPSLWRCDGIEDCPGISEEKKCGKMIGISSTGIGIGSGPVAAAVAPPAATSRSPETFYAKRELKTFFLRMRRPGSRTERWGPQVHRIAVALHLADNTTFGPGNGTGQEIRYELTIQLLHRLAKDMKLSSQELALYIQALLVSCMEPKNFYGDDLVRELRRRVEANGGGYTNPFLVLSLCNAGDAMTTKDVERITYAYNSHNRPFWTDSQALSAMALSCISSRGSVSVDDSILEDMLEDLKKHQAKNGTVENFRTTALVAQAMLIGDAYKKEFNLPAATKVLTDSLHSNTSFLNAYYALPVLNRKSLLDVNSAHCKKEPIAEEDVLQKTLDASVETITVQYSVWLAGDVNLAKTWRLKMPVNSTIYDAIEMVAKIDNRQKVEYNVVEGKPYVTALNGKQDDPEMGMFWFIYQKSLTSNDDPKIVTQSPADVKLMLNQEIILWYKKGPWSHQNLKPKTAPPP